MDCMQKVLEEQVPPPDFTLHLPKGMTASQVRELRAPTVLPFLKSARGRLFGGAPMQAHYEGELRYFYNPVLDTLEARVSGYVNVFVRGLHCGGYPFSRLDRVPVKDLERAEAVEVAKFRQASAQRCVIAPAQQPARLPARQAKWERV